LLDKAKGEYIAISDHDDIWNPGKLAKQIPFLDTHQKYVWCGTNTLVWFESDHMGYEYFLWENSFFALHSSFVYRNKGFRYPDIMYMNDVIFERFILCDNKKIIYNFKEPLTFRRIIQGANNLSYKRYTLSRKNLKTVFRGQPTRYAIAITWFELMRKLVYPTLRRLKATHLIDKIERFPFRLLGHKIRKYTLTDLEHMGFIIS
jgi:glycosyltransferase involved in cell wall biosynthesis